MALVECFECKKEISTFAKSCPNCGAPVTQPKVTPEPESATQGKWTPDGGRESWGEIPSRPVLIKAAEVIEPKKVGILLGAGILIIPYVFVWFLLRKGHSTLSRIVGFSWMGVLLIAANLPDKGEILNFGSNNPSSYVEREAADTKAKQEAARKEEVEAQKIANMQTFTAGQLARAYEENTVAADQKFKGKQFKVSGEIASINTDMFGDPYITLRGGVNQFMEPQFAFEKEHANQIAQLRKGMKVTLLCIGRGDVAKTPISKNCQIR